MKLNVKFKEINQRITPKFGEVFNVSDGGFERGYDEGYSKGETAGYNKGNSDGYAEGYENGYAEGAEANKVFQNPTYGTYYVADMVVNASGLTFGNLVGSPNLKTFTLYGVKEIGYGGGTNILANCPNLKSICLPDLYLLNSWFCEGCTALETIQVGSIGVPVTLIRTGDPFKGCTQTGLTITVYVDATTLAGIPSDVIKKQPWGATNATIVYRNSTTGEVITE